LDRIGKMKLFDPSCEEPGDKGPLAMGEKGGEKPLSLPIGVEACNDAERGPPSCGTDELV
jgi:hypothetical protein